MSVVDRLHRKLDSYSVHIEGWALAEQGISVLWGASGSGKTTILRALVGLDTQADLVWRWGDQDLGRLSASQRNLGLVFQDLALFPHLSVRDNILFPVDQSKHPHWQQDFDELCQVLGLESLLSRAVHKLSGGEKQRVALARAMVYRPRMLLLDEPFSSLDDANREQAWQLIRAVNKRFSCPVLLVTHDRRDVEALADQITEIEQGRIVKTLILS